MKTTEAYPLLLDALHEVRAEWRRSKILEGALLALAGAAAVVTLLVAADNLAAPGPLGRWLLAVLLWGGLAAALVGLVLRRVWEDRRDDFFAALVEQKHPELRNQLINALQLGRGDQRGFSPGLIAAVIHDAGKTAADMDMGDSIDRRPARRAAVLALVALLVVGGYAVAFTPQFATGLVRVLLPFTDQAPYTRTHIKSVDPGKPTSRVIEGQDFAVEAVVDRGVPEAAELVRRIAGGDWRRETAKAEDGPAGVFRWKAGPVLDSFDYYVAAGDARSDIFHVEAIKPPRVERIVMTYSYPQYLGLPDERDRRFRRRRNGGSRHDGDGGAAHDQAASGSGAQAGSPQGGRGGAGDGAADPDGEGRRRPHLGRLVRAVGPRRPPAGRDARPGAGPAHGVPDSHGR